MSSVGLMELQSAHGLYNDCSGEWRNSIITNTFFNYNKYNYSFDVVLAMYIEN